MTIQPGTLYLIGTPIGNLGDLSPRALEILAGVDFVAAEDTRVTGSLLLHFGIKRPLVSYYEHNLRQRGEQIVARLQAGESCALCTDAGMPAISDPGCDIVRLCREAGIPVTSAPGPSAVTTALALSGLETGRFTFEGFLSTNRKNRTEHLEELRQERRTMVFYEAPHKLRRTLSDLFETLGEREIALCREMTKLHEEVLRTTLSQAIAHFEATEPRGEFVLVVEGFSTQALPTEDPDLEQALRDALAQGLSGRDAVKRVSEQCKVPKNQVYACYTSLTD
ncbi:MAG: 16S rRNA (cytidine(1402)-2'-O)-methyltransferase [Clostridia bacterium]|nr:16S rRNA (cytidine(1402)-2'-O)-methyltransferase [Clostridia bacterium]